MDDYDAFFNAPDTDSSAFLPNTCVESFLDDSMSNHANFFQEYDINDPVEGQQLDDPMEEGQSSTTQHEEATRDPSEFQFRSYNLRPTSVRDGKAVWITWLDTDDSGNYDPNKPDADGRMGRSRRRSSSRHKRPRSGSVQHSRDYSSENDECDVECECETEPAAAYLSRLAARQQGISVTVTLDLTTTALQKLAAKIPDNWSGENHNILSDEHYQFLADQLNNRSDNWKPYNLRDRNSVSSDEIKAEEGVVLAEGRIPDPMGEEVDLSNHPAARGCKSCRGLQIDCSLLVDEFTWPCYTCER